MIRHSEIDKDRMCYGPVTAYKEQKTIVVKEITHRNAQCLFLFFEYDSKLIRAFKQVPSSRYSNTHKAWYCMLTMKNVQLIKKHLASLASIDFSNLSKFIDAHSKQLPEDKAQRIELFKQWLQSKRYSENTINTYCDALKTFLLFFKEKRTEEINNQDVIIFNNEYILKKGYSSSFQNQVVNAIKLFLKTIENKVIAIDLIHRPRRERVLPNVLSKDEVRLILNAHSNIKHKAMLSLIYSCGLRCGELLSLKAEHIDSRRNVLLIKQAKGCKDRIAPLSLKTIELLREYYIACKPEVYLFEGQKKGSPYDVRSLQQVLKQALQKAKITKPVSLHWLRHSYATHLLENGTDLRYIQEILGHSRSTTTEIYTHVSTKGIQNIVSPFDTL